MNDILINYNSKNSIFSSLHVNLTMDKLQEKEYTYIYNNQNNYREK